MNESDKLELNARIAALELQMDSVAQTLEKMSMQGLIPDGKDPRSVVSLEVGKCYLCGECKNSMKLQTERQNKGKVETYQRTRCLIDPLIIDGYAPQFGALNHCTKFQPMEEQAAE